MNKGVAGSVRAAGPIGVGLGLLLIVASFVLPRFDRGQSDWSTDDALELQQAAARFHELSFSTSVMSSREDKQQLRDAAELHKDLNDRRRAAIDAAEWRKMSLRWAGVAITLAGIFVWHLQRPPFV